MIQHRPRLGALFVILAGLQFACMDTLSKWLSVDFPIAQLMWFRAIAFLSLTIWLLGRTGLMKAARSRRPLLQSFTALLLLIEGGVFALALRYMPLADAHALGSMAPLAVVALSALWLREKVDAGRWLAVLAGCVGMLVILRPGLQQSSWAVLLPLSCVAMWAVFQILSRKCSQADDAHTSMAWTAVVGLAASTLVLPWNWVTPGWSALGLIVVLASLGAGALFCLIKALDLAQASFLQPFNYFILVWVTLLGAAVFGDVPDGWTILGACVIVVSGLVTLRREVGLNVAGRATVDGATAPA